jgi:phage terminase small subunit
MVGRRKNPATGLTEKQAQFVREYLIDRNGKRSAIRAG